MKRHVCWLAGLAVVALAGRSSAQVEIQNIPNVCPPITIYQAYDGNSASNTAPNGTDLFLEGLLGFGADAITAQPGILSIVPDTNLDGSYDWRKFTRAQPGDVIQIKSVSLTKNELQSLFYDCTDLPPELRAPREVTLNNGDVRLWWPLVYEAPGTTFQLKITWVTGTRKQYPGEPEPAYFHQDIFQWIVKADFDHLLSLLALFHTYPFGTDQVPLISDENLVFIESQLASPGPPRVWFPLQGGTLTTLVENARDEFIAGRYDNARTLLEQFQSAVSTACIGTSPTAPVPTGDGTGTAETLENPACCKLVMDAQWILENVIPSP